MWGHEPTRSALAARDQFVRAGVADVLIPGVGYGRNAKPFLDAGMAVTGIDRFLSNKGIDVAELTPGWVRFVLGGRTDVIVALDWTEFDDDDHATIAAYARRSP